jgi:hypothetical protein
MKRARSMTEEEILQELKNMKPRKRELQKVLNEHFGHRMLQFIKENLAEQFPNSSWIDSLQKVELEAWDREAGETDERGYHLEIDIYPNKKLIRSSIHYEVFNSDSEDDKLYLKPSPPLESWMNEETISALLKYVDEFCNDYDYVEKARIPLSDSLQFFNKHVVAEFCQKNNIQT